MINHHARSRDMKAAPHLPNVTWRRSIRSQANGNCVEVAGLGHAIGVRDTKQEGRGPVLTTDAGDWAAFVAAVKSDSLT